MNIYEMPGFPINDEVISILAQNEAVRIERIISTGQQSDWYDQEECEYVILLEGRAQLEFEDDKTITLEKGDTLLIPSHQKHRVAYTSADPPCIWLCVFY
jgi:cupin 2 domain-containing protein